MQEILLCTKSKNILFHWMGALCEVYQNCLHVRDKIELEEFLSKNGSVIVLFDSNFVQNPIEDIDFYTKEYLKIKIFYLEDIPSYQTGKKLLPLGIKGYGNNRISKQPLLQAVETISNDKVWLYPDFIQDLIKDVTPFLHAKDESALDSLTNKEKEIAMLVSQGLSNNQIAVKSGISESTVKVHIRSIFSKLNIKDRLSLALLVNKH